jgi:ribonuclease P protein component
LTQSDEISRVAKEGKRIRTAHLEVRIVASPLLYPRVGFVVAKYGHTVVERNRLKRRLREIVRTQLLAGLGSIDMIVRAQASAYDAPFSALVEELTHMLGSRSSL